MIPNRPEPPALPGVIPQPAGPGTRIARWTRDQCIRLRWEIAPLAGTALYGTAIEAYALTAPGWSEPTAFGVLGAALGGITLPVISRHQVAAYATAAGAAVSFWSCWQLAAGPSFGGILIGSILGVVGSIPYWRFIASRRDTHVFKQADVEIARYGAMEAYAGMQIPGQREKPAIESVEQAATRVPGQMPTVPWPGTPANPSINKPFALSDNTRVLLPGGHILVVGETQAGKSSIEHVIVCNAVACPDAQVIGIDMKPGRLELGAYRMAGARVAEDVGEATELLEWVIGEGDRRGRLLGVSFEETGEIRNQWTATPDGPHLVVVLDEVAELVRQAPKLAKKLEAIASVLTALGITLVVCTQVPSKDVWGGNTDARGQFDTRVCLRTAEQGHTQIGLGNDAIRTGFLAHDLEAQGEFYIRSRHHRRPEPDRAYLITNRVRADHIRAYASGAVRLDPETEPAAFPVAPEPAFQTTGTVSGDILAYLAEHDGSPVEVARAIGANKGSVRALMSKLNGNGDIREATGGRYRIAPKGRTIAGEVVKTARRRKP